MYGSHRGQKRDSKNQQGDSSIPNAQGFLNNANNHALMPEDVHSGQTPIPLRHSMGPYSHEGAFDGPMHSFAPADFHEPHDLQQAYPAWSGMDMGNAHPPSLNIYPEALDPALYPSEMYPSSTQALNQQLPFPHGDHGAMPFEQNYHNSWDHLPHPGVLPWQNTNNGSTPNPGANTGTHGADPHLGSLPPNQHSPSTNPMHPQHTLPSNSFGKVPQEKGLFGRSDGRQAADNIADKTKVKSILGNMQRMDSRYRSYAREHLLDIDLGKTLSPDRTSRTHRTSKKRNRARNTSKKRKRGEVPA